MVEHAADLHAAGPRERDRVLDRRGRGGGHGQAHSGEDDDAEAVEEPRIEVLGAQAAARRARAPVREAVPATAVGLVDVEARRGPAVAPKPRELDGLAPPEVQQPSAERVVAHPPGEPRRYAQAGGHHAHVGRVAAEAQRGAAPFRRRADGDLDEPLADGAERSARVRRRLHDGTKHSW